ncbi:hypothetical protein [Bosea sp. Root381]|uniref:hypothetical protein n=1 Tax=Bosea sp. Root381 TaxID=1736524 RepID=UPI0012E3CC70|nr:hypothetical protein [Bosea sp. Root381]
MFRHAKPIARVALSHRVALTFQSGFQREIRPSNRAAGIDWTQTQRHPLTEPAGHIRIEAIEGLRDIAAAAKAMVLFRADSCCRRPRKHRLNRLRYSRRKGDGEPRHQARRFATHLAASRHPASISQRRAAPAC